MFECPRWERDRIMMQTAVAETVTPENIVGLMTRSENNWRDISRYIRKVVRVKEMEER